MNDELRLAGLDGANPLGFLTALGVMHLASGFAPGIRMRWDRGGQGWRPVVSGQGCDRSRFVDELRQMLERVRDSAFDLSPSLPYERSALRAAMLAASNPPGESRFDADLLAGQGTDAFADEKGMFTHTSFRLVRKGDSVGNGLPAYVRRCREALLAEQIDSALFDVWRYEDDCPSLRWAPQEDQSHALRWDDPATNKAAGSRGIRAANALAASALALLPVQPIGKRAHTTGFAEFGKRWYFVWPLWTESCSIDVVRSLLSLPDLFHQDRGGDLCRARGIEAVMRSERVQASDYYWNFAPARPL